MMQHVLEEQQLKLNNRDFPLENKTFSPFQGSKLVEKVALLNQGDTIFFFLLTNTYVPELVTLAVAFHMCYRARTLSLTQVVVVRNKHNKNEK